MPTKISDKNMSQLILQNHPLAPLTTWKIGGAAQYLAMPRDLEEVYALMRLAYERGWPIFFLGRGSNVLIADEGLPGLTLHLARSLLKLERRGDYLRSGAGVPLPRLARFAAQEGFSGFEFLAGIPGTVGAAVRLNAGAFGRNLGDVLRRIWVVTPQLHLVELDAAALGLSYRSSLLLNFPHWLVAEAEFKLGSPAPPAEITAQMTEFLAVRQARHPANPRSCGSVFKNPQDSPTAGWLIDDLGLKGRRVGDAQVSRKHANFILNQGRATAAQVKALMAEIQERVWQAHHIALEREVVFLPEDLA
jgi:UDP-N-acetylmuramate dehydrogenase